MRYFNSIIVAAVLCSIGASAARAADVVLIGNPSITATSLTPDEVKNVFLATKSSLANGNHVEPVLMKSGSAHETFVKEYLGKTDSALETYYRSLVFTGKASMPKTVASDAEMVDYVAKTKGAIGYVSAGTNPGGAKAIEVK